MEADQNLIFSESHIAFDAISTDLRGLIVSFSRSFRKLSAETTMGVNLHRRETSIAIKIASTIFSSGIVGSPGNSGAWESISGTWIKPLLIPFE